MIKKTTSLLLLNLCVVLSGYAQVNLSALYNDNSDGHSALLTVALHYKHHEFGIGAGVNINHLHEPSNQGNFSYNQLYAQKPAQYLRVQTFYHFYPFPQWKYCQPVIFYDLQYSHAMIRNRGYSPISVAWGDTSLYPFTAYALDTIYFGPFHWINQSIGIGVTIRLYQNLFLVQKVGMGISLRVGAKRNEHGFLVGTSEDGVGASTFIPPIDYDIGYVLQLGLSYRFPAVTRRNKTIEPLPNISGL
jgi:hypothetical protein